MARACGRFECIACEERAEFPPDSTPGEYEFDFTRFGPRVPTVLVSPYIEAGTVLRPPDGAPPFDHTSVLKTLETRFGIAAST